MKQTFVRYWNSKYYIVGFRMIIVQHLPDEEIVFKIHLKIFNEM